MTKEDLKENLLSGDTVLFINDDTEDFAECFVSDTLMLFVISFNGKWVHSGKAFHPLWMNLQKWITKYNLTNEDVV